MAKHSSLWKVFVFMLLFAWASPSSAQLALNLIALEPATSPTSLGQVSVLYDLTSPNGDPVSVSFFRDDGISIEVVGLVPGTGPYRAIMPLPTNVDGRVVRIQAVARQAPSNVLVPGNRILQVTVDDLAPTQLIVDRPSTPYASFGESLSLEGRVFKGTALEDAGRVEVRREEDAALLGAGPIGAGGQYRAAVDLASLPVGLPVSLTLQAFDGAGNGGATASFVVTRQGSGQGSLSDIEMTPPDGTITSAPGIRVKGKVTGPHGPYQVSFLVNGLVECSLTGLSDATVFAHNLNLPFDGNHRIALRLQRGLEVLMTRELGLISFDRARPSAPTRDEGLQRRFRRLHGLNKSFEEEICPY